MLDIIMLAALSQLTIKTSLPLTEPPGALWYLQDTGDAYSLPLDGTGDTWTAEIPQALLDRPGRFRFEDGALVSGSSVGQEIIRGEKWEPPTTPTPRPTPAPTPKPRVWCVPGDLESVTIMRRDGVDGAGGVEQVRVRFRDADGLVEYRFR